MFVVLVKADERRRDLIVTEEVAGSARVLRGHQRHLAQDPQRPQRDVLEVADRRGDDEERARLVGLESLVPREDSLASERCTPALHGESIVRLEVGPTSRGRARLSPAG